MTSAVPTRLVGLPGSLRKESLSRATLAGLRDDLSGKASLEILSPKLPLYNEDDDDIMLRTRCSSFEMRSRTVPA